MTLALVLAESAGVVTANTTTSNVVISAPNVSITNAVVSFQDGSTLNSAVSVATGGGTDKVFWLNGTTVNNSYTIPANTNAGTFGPVTIANTANVTISNNSVWTIV